ncbi:MAG: hypothetical protein NZ840_00615 [Anaerolineales bacterium]|nr:hypothetical protein [Anaerolineales bacterium]MDW8160539.1 hypothetical protein [Anaerolineales bacterium]
MTWIHFSGERDFLDVFLACERQKLLRLGDAHLILLQAHPFPCTQCSSFLSHLIDCLEAAGDIRARVLVVSAGFERLTPQGGNAVLSLPEQLLPVEQVRASLGNFFSQTSVLLFDPYGSLWFAWSGEELAVDRVQEVLRWLTYLDIQCPE